jgi:LacI family transcriptional regulator
MPKTLPSTKHFKLAQSLRNQIRAMQPGNELPTVLDLKKTYQVSQATVERALDRLRREGLILRPSGKLRVVVANQPDPAEHHIAMIRPDYPSPTFEELARVIIEAGKRRDWAFDLISYRKLDSLNIRRATGDNEAAILLPDSQPFPDHLRTSLRRPSRPIVVIQDPPLGLPINSVRVDDVEIARIGVKHLAELGHKRILLFLNEPKAPSGQLRAQGWRQQMEEIGQTNLDELVVDCQLQPFQNSIVVPYAYMRKWLEAPHPPFTAVFCACSTGALAAMRAFREHGLNIPKDVSLVSHGGEGYIGAFLYPALTAIETNIATYGEMVVDLLYEQLNDPQAQTRNLVVPSSLVVRETTAPL